ncbi:hypothetical protein [Priestia megaterium]|uniref:hypothetical protein n=1 Tax=Priestia megaterium TaxID=1404 RepID=UPI0037CA665B
MKKLQRAVIKEELYKLTGDAVKSLILNQFIFWTEIAYKMDEKTKEEINAFEKQGAADKAEKLKKDLRNGWFFKSAREMAEEIIISKRATVDRKMAELAELPFISVKTPEEMGKEKRELANRSNWYIVDLKMLQLELIKLGYNLDGYTLPDEEETVLDSIAQNEQSEETALDSIAQNEQSIAQNEQSIAHDEQSYSNILHKETYNNSKVSMYVSASADKIFDLYKENFKPTKYAKQSIFQYCEDHPVALVALAIERAVTAEADKPVAFIKGTLKNWKGCLTVEDVLTYEENFRRQKQAKKEKKQSRRIANNKIIRKELAPDWLKESDGVNGQMGEERKHTELDETFEREKAKLAAELQALDNDLKSGKLTTV